MSDDLEVIDLHIDDASDAISLFGPNDRNLKALEKALEITIVTRGEGRPTL